ncbi:ankyrin repeat domain-containing protein [Robertkochia marina]|uniref:Ankyrin repeat domain-containing protein n=1 Tax=Robertkochia marina TaxID=1227945 RepID=A0A4S3LYV5_9FLAO|nr:ankyrin repeat domain-containing protein [Robertkochia marina]THD66331.1 ankyrin repeat domain-containing protein [Robertkochia marina]TRZ44015.1 ankyrin repeat domain-containing protein [Robertkochia marina]
MKTLTVIAALLLAVTTTQAMNTTPETNEIPTAITESGSYNLSPFCFAIAKGDIEMVKKLIDLGADVNARSRGMTPLMYAAKYNRVEIINLLLKNGADKDLKDSRLKITAIKYAELSNAKEAKKVLAKA